MIMKKRTEDYFNDNLVFNLENYQRKYFGLNEISDDYQTKVFYSKTYNWYKKTIIYFSGNIIVKVICHEIFTRSEDVIGDDEYREFDTYLETINQESLIPLTNRGKIKKVNPTNVLALTPFGCEFRTRVIQKRLIWALKPRSMKYIPIGEDERIENIKTIPELKEFIKWYVSTCSSDYIEKVEAVKSSEHKTVKFKIGDLFRTSVDRKNYAYGIIIGRTRDIEKWKELPSSHSYRSFMTQPILVRFYNLLTERDDLKKEDLKDIPLLSVEVCSDGDIFWGAHPVVDHKKLEPDDIMFNFICTKIVSPNKHKTLFTDDHSLNSGIWDPNDLPEYSLYIEWGFANTTIPKENVSSELKELLKDYKSPYAGVKLGINDDHVGKTKEYLNKSYRYTRDLLTEENNHILRAIFRCLGINEDTTYDEFNNIYKGLTRSQYIERLYS